ncbi:sulfite oxidase [Dyadobacter psychrotolerans]|uniref:Twin-arginine translocation signal domain-containing protein n=1 Tax=Dyadobacter psychrotolerans TaxID=2541721 RepID=A0A4R5DL30_9BACT|nr:sulfite oxidase [Dyadobacter psychrotolerans]TDE12740.1 twin-arginine translocation signal domain-containing protein [Dyadobacter psychrotolerans]
MKFAFDRRGFLKKTSLAAITAALGSEIVFADKLPRNYIPLVFDEKDALKGKNPDMIVQGDKPWNVETPLYLLDDKVTPIDKMFIRNNGLIPEKVDVKNWTLTIDGESSKSTKTYTLEDLKKRFKTYTYQLVLECGGNGRSGFQPQTSGNAWGQGAVHCAQWTGVRLKDILNDVGVKSDAVYIGYHGKDIHLSRDPKKESISRGVPIAKAMEDETLIAWAVNGKDIPEFHGYPLRLVIGGWPASVSGKWLSSISIRNKVHDGAKMDGHSYKMPKNPVAPGQDVPQTDEYFKIIESMPVKSIITYPKTGAVLTPGTELPLRGHAWAGDVAVKSVDISIDFGATWQNCKLETPANRLAWQHWNTKVKLPQKGYYEVWVRATDAKGVSQPMISPAWNPGGYLNNACERIAVKVE